MEIVPARDPKVPLFVKLPELILTVERFSPICPVFVIEAPEIFREELAFRNVADKTLKEKTSFLEKNILLNTFVITF